MAKIFVMAATPFTSDDRLDETGFRAHLARLVGSGTAVCLGGGGGGEGHALSLAELQRVYEIGVEACRGRVPVCATVPEARTAAATIEKCRLAVNAGAEVMQIFYPDAGHGMRPTPSEQDAGFRDILDAIDHPVALSVDMHAAFAPSVPAVKKLCADYRHVVAVNLIGMPLPYMIELMDALGPRVEVYTLMGSLINALHLGSAGCLAAEPNIIPNLCQSVLSHFAKGDITRCGEAYTNVVRFGAIVNRWGPGSARWVKAAMKVLGLPGGNGHLRRPYLLPPPAELDDMARAFDRLGIRQLEGLA